jgi:hypothetical protein
MLLKFMLPVAAHMIEKPPPLTFGLVNWMLVYQMPAPVTVSWLTQLVAVPIAS